MTKKPRLLLVEDEEHIAQGLIFNLELEGYHVLEAHNGLEALEVIRTQLPDLVLLDIWTMLPGWLPDCCSILS